MVITPS